MNLHEIQNKPHIVENCLRYAKRLKMKNYNFANQAARRNLQKSRRNEYILNQIPKHTTWKMKKCAFNFKNEKIFMPPTHFPSREKSLAETPPDNYFDAHRSANRCFGGARYRATPRGEKAATRRNATLLARSYKLLLSIPFENRKASRL